jgi:hypothetical protein
MLPPENILAEELLTEVLDINTSKSYDFVETDPKDIPAWAGTPIVYEVTFETENKKQYAVRVFKNNRYGANTRCICVMLKKQIRWSRTLVIDPSTFKAVMVTLLKAYSAYKDTTDGKMASGMMVIMQNGINDRAGLLVKAISRSFKAEPKKKLSFYAATDEGKRDSTWLFFTINSSPYPFFKGKQFKAEWTVSPLFKKLSGADSVIAAKETPVMAVGIDQQKSKPDETEENYAYAEILSDKVRYEYHGAVVEKGSIFKFKTAYVKVLEDHVIAITSEIVSPEKGVQAAGVRIRVPKAGNDNTKMLSAAEYIQKKADLLEKGEKPKTAQSPTQKSQPTAIEYIYVELIGDGAKLNFPGSPLPVGTLLKFMKGDSKVLSNSKMTIQVRVLITPDGKTVYDRAVTVPMSGDITSVIPMEVYEKKKAAIEYGEVSGEPTPVTVAEPVKVEVEPTYTSKEWKFMFKNGYEITVDNFVTFDDDFNYFITKTDAITTVLEVPLPVGTFVKYKFNGQASGNNQYIIVHAEEVIYPNGSYANNLDLIVEDDSFVKHSNETAFNTKKDEAVQAGTLKSLNNVGKVKQDTLASTELDAAPKVIKMITQSGSSSLPAGALANVIEFFPAITSHAVINYKIPNSVENYFLNSGDPLIIVSPTDNSSKFVALSVMKEGIGYVYVSGKGYKDKLAQAKANTAVAEVPDSLPPALKITDKPVSEFYSDRFKDWVKANRPNLTSSVEFMPGVTIDLPEYDFLALGEKLRTIGEAFGTQAAITRDRANVLLGQLRNKSSSIADFIESQIEQTGLYLKPGSKGVAGVKAYSGTDYSRINDYIRKPPEEVSSYNTETLDKIRKIDDAFRLYGIRLPKDLPVYRGASISDADVAALDKGGVHVMDSYSSASLKTYTAEDFFRAHPEVGVLSITQTKDNTPVTIDYSIGSKQGNKIFFTIRGLDRCISLYIAQVSQFSHEKELLINRGTSVKCEVSPTTGGLTKPVLVHKSKNGVKCWAARVTVANSLTESTVSFRSLLEQRSPDMKELLDMNDKYGLIMYKLQLILDDAEEEELNKD